MTNSELFIQEFLDCLFKNGGGIISTSHPEDQTRLTDGLLADHLVDSADQPVSNFLEKLWLSQAEPQIRESKCRSCSFWMDPGRLASFGLCCRLVLAYSDLLTRNEEMIPGEPHDPLYTPEDFLCSHFAPRPSGGAEAPASSNDQVLFLTRVIEEYCIPQEADLPVNSGSAGDGNVR
jgi:hypothetical protein